MSARTPAKILALAAGLALLQASAHALLFVSAHPRHGPEEVAVVEAMKAHYFTFGDFARSYWDFYFGSGLLAALNVFVEAALLWQLAVLARADAHRLRPIVALLALANVAHAALCLRYFFLTPVVADLVIALCLAWSYVVARPRNA
jgi:hypothetical protein